MNGLAICAGAAGLELGLYLALRDAYRTVGYVERDAYAAACLVARMEDETLEPTPVWDDLATFDGRPWRGRVDCVTAGLPCQPFSGAGQQAGVDDERHLWPLAERVIVDVAPHLVFMENVPDVVLPRFRWLEHVLGSFAAMGFDAEWGVLSAADVGATHLRRRFFLLAYRDRGRLENLRRECRGAGARVHDLERSGGATVADAGGAGRSEVTRRALADESDHAGWSAQQGDESDGASEDVADATRVSQREPNYQERTLTRERARVDVGWSGHFPPGPDDPAWHDGTFNGPQPSVRRDADGLASRLERLHTIGNGVVPLVAAVAFRRLVDRALVGVTG